MCVPSVAYRHRHREISTRWWGQRNGRIQLLYGQWQGKGLQDQDWLRSRYLELLHLYLYMSTVRTENKYTNITSNTAACWYKWGRLYFEKCVYMVYLHDGTPAIILSWHIGVPRLILAYSCIWDNRVYRIVWSYSIFNILNILDDVLNVLNVTPISDHWSAMIGDQWLVLTRQHNT